VLSLDAFLQRMDIRRAALDSLRDVAVAAAEGRARRAELQRAVFQVLDADADTRLGVAELRRFAAAAGFDGTEAQWATEFRSLCAERGADPLFGLAVEEFIAMTDDRGSAGCYCSTEELADILGQLLPAVPAPTSARSLRRSRSRSSARARAAADEAQVSQPAPKAAKLLERPAGRRAGAAVSGSFGGA